MDRLVLKNTEGKPPFIGIIFMDEKDALKSVTPDFKEKEYKLIVNENYGRIFLNLRDKEDKQVRYYRAIEYDHKEYKLWRAYTHLRVNFGHCFMKGDELKVARSGADLYVLKIIEFIHY